MEKESKKIVSLDERLAKAREVAKKSQCCTFRYNHLAPSERKNCRYMELSHEEAEKIIPQLSKVFKQDIDVSRFNIVCVSDDTFLKFGIENGEGFASGEKWRFNYLMVQNGEFVGMQINCKNKEGKGMDHEVFPVFSVSCMPEESQELISSMLDIVEDRME